MSGLDPFYNTFNNPSNIFMASFGDSTTEGNVTVTNGGWPEQLRVLAAPRWGRGGDGCHPMNRDPWTITSGGSAWTAATSSNVWDCAPLNGGAGTPAPVAYLGNGSTVIATWTMPGSLTTTAFTFYMVDGPSSDNFSYSLDGGTSWTDVTATWSQNNTITKIRINSAVTTSIKVRAANAAGTAVNTYIVGLEPHTSSPGFVIHNVAANAEYLLATVRTTAGNWHAWLDIVQPPLITVMYTNDVLFYSQASWRANLTSIANIVTGYGGCVLFMSMFEQFGRNITTQANMRADVKFVANNFGMPVIDFYDLVGDANATLAAGYYNTNADIHENNTGAIFMAQQIWSLIGKSGVGAKRRTS